MTTFRLIRVEYNLGYKDFLSFVLEIFPVDLKRYMDACLPVERLSLRLAHVSWEKGMFLDVNVFSLSCRQCYFHQILSAIDYLHRRAIVNFRFLSLSSSFATHLCSYV